MAVRGKAKAKAKASTSTSSRRSFGSTFFATAVLVLASTLGISFAAPHQVSATTSTSADPYLVNRHESLELREEVREAFSFTYDAYMSRAFPKDELNPLSCKGEDTIGSYALTLVDSLDTLAVMGNWTEFAKGAKWVGENMRHFSEIDDTVSVFETNIRVLGGLLSAHVLSENFKQRYSEICPKEVGGRGGNGVNGDGDDESAADPFINVKRQCRSGDLDSLASYQGSLLEVALDLGNRLARAFEDPRRSENATKTGIPYGAVHLQKGVLMHETEIASTAGATTLAVEFGVLSRLTKDPKFERLAKAAMTSIWEKRSKLTGLVGAHINITSGMWTHLDSGIGASIDSYYEYLLKGNVLLGIEEFGPMFHQAYHSVEEHLRVGPWYVEVNMETGVLVWPLFNSLQAFWPGLQTSMASCSDDHKPFANGKMETKTQFRSTLYHQSTSRNAFLKKEISLEDFSDLSEQELIHEGYGCENRSDVESHDLSKAIETHGAMFEVWRRHGNTPEGYSLSHVEPQPGQTAYPLRPELIESTYYLYLATRDPAYLVVGRDILASLQHRCRTKTCGYASLEDVDTGAQRDHMESFFLAETLKYLYLLFDAGSKKMSESIHHVVSEFSHEYIFSTEGHIFPLVEELGAFGMPELKKSKKEDEVEDEVEKSLEKQEQEEDANFTQKEDSCNEVIEGYCRPLHPIWNAPRYKRHLLPLDAYSGEEVDDASSDSNGGKGDKKEKKKKKKKKKGSQKVGKGKSRSGWSNVKTSDEDDSPVTSLFDGSHLMVGAMELQKNLRKVLSKMFNLEDDASVEATLENLVLSSGKGSAASAAVEEKEEGAVPDSFPWTKEGRNGKKGTCSKRSENNLGESLLKKALTRNVHLQ